MKKFLLYLANAISVVYFLYYWLFATVFTTRSAVMQLEDSDVAYAVGSNWATSSLGSSLVAVAITIVCVTVIHTLLKKRKVK